MAVQLWYYIPLNLSFVYNSWKDFVCILGFHLILRALMGVIGNTLITDGFEGESTLPLIHSASMQMLGFVSPAALYEAYGYVKTKMEWLHLSILVRG